MMRFNKVFFLLCVSIMVASSVLARDHKKCTLVGSYTGRIGDNPVEAQFNADGTATVYFISLDPLTSIAFVGAWKCSGDNCFIFCAVNRLAQLKGEICFSSCQCTELKGTGTTSGDGTSESFVVEFNRVNCL